MTNRQKIITLFALAIVLITIVAVYYQFIAKTLHPDIEKYYVISLDVSDIKKRVESGEPFTVTLGNKQVELLIKPVPFVNEDLKILERKKDKVIERKIEGVTTYAGIVTSAKSKSDARFTIAKGLLIGSVQIDEEWWFIEPLVKFQANAADSDYIVYRAKDTKFKIPFGKDTPEKPPGSSFLQNSGSQSITRALTTHTFRQTGAGSSNICIVLVADRDLMDWIEEVALVEWREYPELFMLSVLNFVNGVYQREIGHQFIVTHILIDDDNSFLSSTNRDTLLNQLVNFVTNELGDLRRERERLIHRAEVAHLLTGKEIDGDTVGYANRPGHYGFSQISFHHVEGYRFPLYYQNTLIMTHELGHNFNGVHAEADEWCVTNFIWCWDYVRTVLWDTLYDDNVDEFSDGSRNSSHNNLDRIRTNWESRVGACDGPTIDSPTISSPTHTRGQASCNRVMTLNWGPPATPVGLQGYSYVVVSQDDPYYDQNRTPDESIDLGPTITSFTTPLLEPGHVWEFNLVAIDDVGTRSPYYSSFWAAIESCSVDVWVIPRENAVFSVGEWVNIYYGPATYDGLDVSGCYAVSLDMMKGANIIQNIVTNMSYTLSYGFRVPEVEPASDYNIRIRLDREPFCDQYSGLPATMTGTSNHFSVVVP